MKSDVHEECVMAQSQKPEGENPPRVDVDREVFTIPDCRYSVEKKPAKKSNDRTRFKKKTPPHLKHSQDLKRRPPPSFFSRPKVLICLYMTMKEEGNTEKSKTAHREEEMLALWREHSIFEKSLEQTKDGEPFIFFDGPPFATGLPHYGHILAGTIKDAIPRYQTMKGRYVPRQWGWDCHGLPLENEIEKELGLKTKKDIEEYGIQNFNEKARAAVLRYDEEWKETVPRMGRFVDMDQSYKTMDWTYTESIWWAFNKLHKEKLAYEGFKAMLLCPRCGTTLANFEVAQGYADITDWAVYIKLPLADEEHTSLLAWTTTAWTLPGNMAAAVHEEATYGKYEITGNTKEPEYIIVAKERADDVFSDVDIKLVAEFTGADLIGKAYTPPFDYYTEKDFQNKEHAWKVYHAPYVSLDDGTGIVHIAPAFGAEDMELAQEKDIPLVHHVAQNGTFVDAVTDFAGEPVKPKGDHQKTDARIADTLAKKGVLFKKEEVTHSYPHCWRCDTPLLNYATHSWFVRVRDVKEQMAEENKNIHWVPEHVGKHRFQNLLAEAPDWSISRARYWGAPLPVWKCNACEKQEVFGSVDDLYKRTNGQITKLIFIRHGQSEKNKQNILDSSADTFGLTDKGKEQVVHTAHGLQAISVDAVYASTIRRAQETADIISDTVDVPVTTDERINEVTSGNWEGKAANDPEIAAEREAYFALSLEERHNAPRGGTGESWMDVEERMRAFLEDVKEKHKGETVVIATHLGTITTALRILQNVPLKEIAVLRGRSLWEEYAYPHVMYVDHNTGTGFDFHRPYIDNIMLDCECGGEMKRIEDVFDCWFESGSMPYSRLHYPFERVERFKQEYPADFIAEGVDQTRGWFYSLLVLGTALFGKAPYKNVIVNGQVLAADGKKMSKRLKNYPDPMDVANKYGADSMRYYLLSSPIVRSEDTAFVEKGVDEIHKKLILRLQNVVSFYEMYQHDTNTQMNANDTNEKSDNVLDRWITARLHELITQVTEAMDNYELDKATRPIAEFIDDLSTWYIRRSRDRFKADNEEDKKAALHTTCHTLLTLSKIMAPFTPFVAEDIYQRIGKEKESVHLEGWPFDSAQGKPERQAVDEKILEEMEEVRRIVSLGLEARTEVGMKVRQPLASLKVKQKNISNPDTTAKTAAGHGKIQDTNLLELIKDEVNVKEVVFDDTMEKEVELDTELTEDLKQEGQMRELTRQIQNMRKNAKLTPDDYITLTIQTSTQGAGLIGLFEDTIKQTVRAVDIVFTDDVDGEEVTVDDIPFTTALKKVS